MNTPEEKILAMGRKLIDAELAFKNLFDAWQYDCKIWKERIAVAENAKQSFPQPKQELREAAQSIANKITFNGKNFLFQRDFEEAKQLILAGLQSSHRAGFEECQRMAAESIDKLPLTAPEITEFDTKYPLSRARQAILSLKPSLEPSEVKKVQHEN